MTREEISDVVLRTIEYIKNYAWADEDGKIERGMLIHDFLKDSRTYFDCLLGNNAKILKSEK